MYAAHNGHLDKIIFLIKNNADITCKSGWGNNTLHLASREGHTHVVDYLAERFPILLYEQGEKGRFPQDMAERYNKNDETVSAYQQSYSNSFFPNARTSVSPHIAMLIAGKLEDPVDIGRLNAVSSSWNRLLNNEQILRHYQNKVRCFLPDYLREKYWKIIFETYYPETKLESDEDVFKAFMQYIHIFYIFGNKIDMLINKSKYEKISEGIISFAFIKGSSPDIKYREVKQKELENNLTKIIQETIDNNQSIKAYRQLSFLTSDELHESNYETNLYQSLHKTRRRIFQITVDSKTALSLLRGTKESCILDPRAVIGAKKTYLGQTDVAVFTIESELNVKCSMSL